MKAPSLSKSTSMAMSLGQENTTPPLKNNQSHVGENDAGENVTPVNNVNIPEEGSEMDTIPFSFDSVLSIVQKSLPMAPPSVGEDKNSTKPPLTPSGEVKSSIEEYVQLNSKQNLSADESTAENNLPTTAPYAHVNTATLAWSDAISSPGSTEHVNNN